MLPKQSAVLRLEIPALICHENFLKYRGDTVRVSVQNIEGNLFSVIAPRNFIAATEGTGARAFFHFDGSIIFANFVPRNVTGQARSINRGEIHHELVHVLRRSNLFDVASWEKLASHANGLQMLDMTIGRVHEGMGMPGTSAGSIAHLPLYHSLGHRADEPKEGQCLSLKFGVN